MHPDDDMAHNVWNEMQRDAAAGAVHEEYEQMKEREDKGMCPMCGSSPTNPAIGIELCVQCAKEMEILCSKNGCLGKRTFRFRQAGFCDPHAVEIAQEEYYLYLEILDKVEELEEEFEELCDDIGYDPTQAKGDESSKSQRHRRAINLRPQIQLLEGDAETHKRTVEKAREEVGEVFHENFEVDF